MPSGRAIGWSRWIARASASAAARAQIYYFEGDLGVTTVSARVTAWADQSGNGNHLAEFGGLFGPALTTENAIQCLNFTAIGSSLKRATFVQGAITRPTTHYALYRQALNRSAGMMVRAGDGTTFVDAWPRSPWVSNSLGGSQGSGGTDFYQYWLNAKSESAGSIDASVGPLVSTSRLHLACIVANGAASAVYVDDMSAPVLTGTLAAGAIDGLLLGQTNAASPPANMFLGALCALVGYTGTDSATQREAVKTLLARWGALG